MASLTKFSTSALCLAVYCNKSPRVTAYVSARPSSAGSNPDSTAKQETQYIAYVLYTYTYTHNSVSLWQPQCKWVQALQLKKCCKVYNTSTSVTWLFVDCQAVES